MSPTNALNSEILRFYVILVGGLLVIAGAVLAVLHWGFRKNICSIWSAYRTWLVMVPLVVGVIFLGRIPTVLFFGLISISALKEFARATGLYRDWWLTGSIYVALGLICLLALSPTSPEGHPGLFGLFRVLPSFVIAFLWIMPIIRNRTEGQLQAVSLSTLGFIYIGWMFGHLQFLADSKNPYGYLLYLIFAVEINDVAAFTLGKLFGRHKLCSKISPNKTWEGALGAFALSMILPWILHFSFPHFGPLQLGLTGLIIGIGGQLGDLTISVIKRDLGIKDMGTTIPGHGGLLDRIDSLIYTTPLFLHMVHFYYGLW